MGSNSTTPHNLHILFFPFMAPGHAIPMLDMTKLFALHGVRTTFITTPANAPLVQPTINRANSANPTAPPIKLTLLPFPSAELGLPSGCENAASLHSSDMRANFFKAVMMLRQPFDQVLKELHPDAIVTDSFLPWTTDAASEFGIPRLVFHGTSSFALCAWHSVDEYNPHERPEESFTIPGLPHRIHMLKSQVPIIPKTNPSFTDVMRAVKESDAKSYGAVVNSFYELEPEYVDHYRNVMGRRAWYVGPVSLCNEEVVDLAGRGALEAVCAGVPMVTMPMLAEQFFNERLLVDVLKIGVGIGVKEYGTGQKFGMGPENVSALVRGEDIEKAVAMLMNAGEEAEEMRRRARELRESAKMALEKGGSSSLDICNLIRELTEKQRPVPSLY
ncbi:hypothetical protein J5N97_027981 [Dioscorea zingiberensis]|uniref:Uncharacterized protein n=1 Tax=Dioscorea zingiberensis TaxID=325984 RepID=A0A9D5BY80_9LILI|nr:hypothetical protein J5N97_027981 [Dioscorea zingiberensis]